MFRLISIFLSFIFILTSCIGNEMSQYQSIEAEGWIFGDTLLLKPLRYDKDTIDIFEGDLSVVVRHTNAYEYSNLWLQLDYTTPDTTMADTINVILADDYGNWLGKGIGISFQQYQCVAKDVKIDLSYPIRVTHIMRADTLCGIEQVGVILTDNEAKAKR